jgi:hypothetical protein
VVLLVEHVLGGLAAANADKDGGGCSGGEVALACHGLGDSLVSARIHADVIRADLESPPADRGGNQLMCNEVFCSLGRWEYRVLQLVKHDETDSFLVAMECSPLTARWGVEHEVSGRLG